MEPLEPLLTTEDVAQYLNVEVVTVRRLVSRGELTAYRVGGEYRFTQGDLREYLERQRIPARRSLPDRGAPVPTPAFAQLLRGLRRGKRVSDGVFDKFTKRAKQVLSFAQEEARAFNHPYLGTEHLLLTLIREEEGIAGKVLEDFGVKLDQARSAVESIVGRGQDDPRDGDMEMTSRAKTAIEHAIEEARRLNHQYIGTEHLLLGLIDVGEGVALSALEIMGISREQVRIGVMRLLTPNSSEWT